MESTLKCIGAEIDLYTLKYNQKRKIENDMKFLGIVKDEAYGHA